MGLAYFFLFLMIIGGAAGAVVLLKMAREVWSGPRWRWLAIVPLGLGLLCAAAALSVLYIVWREPPWRFNF